MTTALSWDDDIGEDFLPRFQEGSSPQHLLVTLLGDYWLMHEEHLPSASLVKLMAEFGVSDVSARSALSRLQRRGVLESSKSGRRTYYGLNRLAARRIFDGARRIVAFGTPEPWDGAWTIIAFSLPEARRDTRHLLRANLRWLGFAPLYDGVWVSPTAAPDAASQALADLNVETATVFTATGVDGNGGLRAPIEAWDLGELRPIYDEFVHECDQLLGVINKGSVTPARALVARTSLMDTYRRFPALDPELPLELMPSDWPRPVARARFHEAFDVLAPLAEIRVRQIVAEFDEPLSRLAQCYSTATLLKGTGMPAD